MRDSGQGGRAAPGDPGSGSGTGFEALARQYWNAWGDALRSASPGAAQAGTQPWQAALAWWSRAAQGGRVAGNDTLARFNAQAGQRSEEHTSELQSLIPHSYAVFCLKKKTKSRNSETHD